MFLSLIKLTKKINNHKSTLVNLTLKYVTLNYNILPIPLPPKNHISSSYCKSIFILSPRVLLVLTEKELSESPISISETQCKLLAVSLYTVRKTSDISKLQWHRIHVCTTKGKQENSKKEWNRDTSENPQGKQ